MPLTLSFIIPTQIFRLFTLNIDTDNTDVDILQLNSHWDHMQPKNSTNDIFLH